VCACQHSCSGVLLLRGFLKCSCVFYFLFCRKSESNTVIRGSLSTNGTSHLTRFSFFSHGFFTKSTLRAARNQWKQSEEQEIRSFNKYMMKTKISEEQETRNKKKNLKQNTGQYLHSTAPGSKIGAFWHFNYEFARQRWSQGQCREVSQRVSSALLP